MKSIILVILFSAILCGRLFAIAPNIDDLRAKAEKGDALAQFGLGHQYEYGEVVAKDPIEAVKWYRKAAEQGFAPAQWGLGYKYDMGEGVAKDLTEATQWYRKAADQGFAEAQYALGVMYRNGEGVAKDAAEAVKWFLKAAEQGNARAQATLGMMFYRGEGVEPKPVEAARWYRKAAEQGNAPAQSILGMMYSSGLGVPKDEIEALAWSNVAAASGDKGAAGNRDMLESRLGQQATLIAQQRSRELLKEIEAKKSRATANTPITNNSVPKSSGSGAIISAAGYVLTAAHVVADAENITVVSVQGTRHATVVRLDKSNDLAVLKIEGGTYAVLPVGPSRHIRLGQSVATIGFPNVSIQGFSPKVTRGEISSLSGVADDPRSWQISVPVQPGNSGGPLLDEYGNLIGVVVAKLGLKAARLTGDVPQNVNYAVKSAYALALLEPYMDGKAPEVGVASPKLGFEDMVAKAQMSVVLVLAY